MIRTSSAPRLIPILLAALTGCSMLHHGDSPQQQFMSALQRGNGPQASQIWLNMNADDRANLAVGKGIKPLTSPDEIKAKLAQQEQAQPDGGIETGDSDSQQVELPPIDTSSSAGLQGLAKLPSTIDSNPSFAPGNAQ